MKEFKRGDRVRVRPGVSRRGFFNLNGRWGTIIRRTTIPRKHVPSSFYAYVQFDDNGDGEQPVICLNVTNLTKPNEETNHDPN